MNDKKIILSPQKQQNDTGIEGTNFYLIEDEHSIPIGQVFLRFEQNNIYIDKNVIYMNDDKKKNNNKIQYETKVQVEEIIDIKIIWSNKDSGLKLSISSSIPIAYISFL